MIRTLLALLPGLLILAYFYGAGIVLNVLFAMLFSLLIEVAALKFRNLPLNTATDGSALLTGALLGLALPPYLPLWMLLTGCVFAIIFAKHIYGGLGQNLFNPAMVGYAVLIISFPLALSDWPATESITYSPMDTLSIKLGLPTVGSNMIDSYTGATPLDEFKFRGALTVDEFWNKFGSDHWLIWMKVNFGFLLGGLYLLYAGVCNWKAPVSMLATLCMLSVVFFDNGSSESLGSPLFHLFTGATMLGAFFIVTDPVTSPDSSRGQIIFGIGVGLLTFIIRVTGAYPEGFAFAILLMNGCSPLIDYIEFRIKPKWERSS
jgi:electron transport complex protein RnfD